MIIKLSDARINADIELHYSDPSGYDNWIVETLGESNPLHAGLVAALTNYVSPWATVLDLGCGTGWCGKKLQLAQHLGQRIGCDMSLPMLRQADSLGVYGLLYYCDACRVFEELRGLATQVDWALCLLMCCYLDAVSLQELLRELFSSCRQGFIVSFEDYGEDMLICGTVLLYSHTYSDVCAQLAPGWQVEVLAGDVDAVMLLLFTRTD